MHKAKEAVGVANYIQISLHKPLQKMLPEVDLKPSIKNEAPSTANVTVLLAYLSLGKFESITVKFNSGKMEPFEGVQRLKAKKRIQYILQKHHYQNRTIQEEDGNQTALFQTPKKEV